jgi:hypothetical protein
MPVPNGVILIWSGANSAIPSGWSRETLLDGKYPKGHGAEDPNTTGGSNTHTHTASHGHTLTDHSHGVSLDSVSASGNCDSGSGTSPRGTHSHVSANIGNTTSGALQSTTVTWQSTNNEPPHHDVIFIKPTDSFALLKQGIITHFNGASVPTGWDFCDGDNGTPNLVDKYLKGASTGNDAGTVGGSLTHAHDVSHGHTADSHAHSGNSGSPNYTDKMDGSDPTKVPNHTHSITLNSSTDTVANYSNTTAGNGDTVEPAYKKIGAIQNTSAPPTFKKGMIGLWLGDIVDIPAGWQVCDGTNDTVDMRDKFIKIPTDLTGNGSVGGSNTHSHTSVSHSHTSTGTHTHTGSHGLPSSQNSAGGQGTDNANYTHTHNLTVGTATASYSSDNITASTVDNQPTYLTVAYVQAMKNDAGGIAAFFL